MVADEDLGWILRILSNGVRRAVIRGLARGDTRYSELIRRTGLGEINAGVFNFHLSKLTDLGLVHKSDDEYELTWKGTMAARYLDKIEEDFQEVVGGKSMKTDGISWEAWEQVKCQREWAHQHAHREPIATLGMTVMYLSGIFEILSYPHKLEITTKKIMTNLKKVAETENEPKLFDLSLRLAEIKKGDLDEFKTSYEGVKETIRLVAGSPKWFEMLPRRIPPEEGRKMIDEWNERADLAKTIAKEGRVLDAIYVARMTAFWVLGTYAEGIPQKTGRWREMWLDTLIELADVDPTVKDSYMKAFGLRRYSVKHSETLLQDMDKHLAVARRIMARHGIEDLTQDDN